MEPPAGAVMSPPVVVVVVAHDPNAERFDALLAALAGQDYPNYRVLVVDAASEVDPTDRVRAALPDGRVLRLSHDPGFGAAANYVLDVAEGAAYYVFCHDDVVPEPGSLSELVDVAATWDAGIAGPKLVDWNAPDHLLQVGMAVDKIGTTMPFVEPGELDQAQHDGLRQVFVVPGAFTLVRADLFEAVGGFDEAVTLLGDDLSLCWRAHLAGARVLITSTTKVRHAQAFSSLASARERHRLEARHRLRSLLCCTSLMRLAMVAPQAMVMSLGEALGALARGRPGRARDALGAWVWNLRRLRSLLVARRHIGRIRRVPDRKVRRFQVQGLLGPRLQLRRIDDDARVSAARAARALPAGAGGEHDPSAWTPATAVVAVALAAVLAFGSRHLLTRFVPAVGELVRFDGDPGALLAEWADGWRHAGLGSSSAPPTLVGLLGAIGWFLRDQMGLVRTVLTVGLLPVGVLGAHRLLRPAGSRRAQLAAAVAYAAAPVPYNALGGGHWSAMAAYAGAPWLLGRLARAARAAPFTSKDAPLAVSPHSLHRHVVAIGVTTALVGIVVPVAPALVLVMGLALAAGSVLAFELRGVGRLVVASLGGAVVAVLLHLPVAVDVLGRPGGVAAWLGVERPAGDLTALELLRFETGQFGASPLGFALAAAAAVPLLVGRGWRLAWAVRGWTVAVAFWSLLWMQQEGWLSVPLPGADVLLAPAAAGLALAVAMGVAALEADVRGRSWRFGFRRSVAAVGGLALVAAMAPVAAASLDGWWRAPRGDFDAVLGFVEADVREVPSRVLWLGDPDVVPGGPGWSMRDGLTYATSLEGVRGVPDLWPGTDDGPPQRLARALDLALDRRTTRLGRLLAPMSVRYIVLPQRAAPSTFASDAQPVPETLVSALGAQLDLEQIPIDPAVVVFRNTAFLPQRAVVADQAALDATDVAELQDSDLSQALPVLTGHDGVGYRGPLPDGLTLVHSAAASDRWTLRVDGAEMPRHRAFGWAEAYDIGAGGDAALSYRPLPSYRTLLVVQAVLWLLALAALLRMRFGGDEPAVVLPPPPVALVPGNGRGSGVPGPASPPGDPGGSRRAVTAVAARDEWAGGAGGGDGDLPVPSDPELVPTAWHSIEVDR